ncbi:hypothetical protein LCGC14_2411030 [marine sediment metagenome]|uniref:Polymerase beta nucleotidyltransferase domain-containing protein n=1 Tax=marine sediment metagenome TaxID=412755 RepID=A0A0F9E4N5_9ZZZZ
MENQMKINDHENSLIKLKRLVVEYLTDEKVQVFLFGSRARNDNANHSDVDIGYIPYGEFDRKKIVNLNERIENSTIPYKVEIVNFNEVSEDFKRAALKDAVIWKD